MGWYWPSSRGQELGKSDEVVGGSSEQEHPSDPIAASVFCLPEAAGRFDPTERLLLSGTRHSGALTADMGRQSAEAAD
jgi:hypothetical protein